MKRIALWASLLVLAVVAVLGPAGGPAAAQALEKVAITQGTHAVSFLPLYVAMYNKYWEEEGLDVEIIFTRGGGECLTAVLSGDAVACSTATPPILQAWVQGHTNLVSVGSLINRFTMNGVIRKEFLAQRGVSVEEFQKMSPLERVRLHQGGVMGITGPGSMTDVFTRWLVKQAGLNPDRDVMIMNLGGASGLYTGLNAGRIDSFFLSPPLSMQPIADGTSVSFIDVMAGELDGFSNFVYEVLVTRRELIEQRPDLVRRVVNGLRKANNFIADHADDAETLGAIAREYFPELDQTVLELSVLGVASGVPRDAQHTEDGWESVLAFVEEGGLVAPGLLDASEGGFWTSEFTQ